MWIGEPPQEYYTSIEVNDENGKVAVYDGGVTVMEMICASVCYTSMICFSMEYRFGSMHSTDSNMQRHRVGARGNVTCFPLPWEQLLEQLQDIGERQSQVPHTGEELADLVRILLKSGGSDADSDSKALLKNASYIGKRTGD